MNYIQRSIETRLLQAMKAYKAVLVTGPRQAGKSTLLKQLFPARKYVSLDDPFLEEQANQNGSTFMMLNQPPITIDEAQRAPMLFRYIKMRCDESEEKGLFCLSGSQQFRLMKNVSETLAGRVSILELPGLSLRELQGDPFALPLSAYDGISAGAAKNGQSAQKSLANHPSRFLSRFAGSGAGVGRFLRRLCAHLH